MESKRAAPEGVKIQRDEKTRIGIWPVFVFAYILVNGLFNFTTVWEVFVISAMAASASAFGIAFLNRSRSALADPLSLAALFWCLLVCVSVTWAVNPQAAFYAFVGYAGSLFLYFIARIAVHHTASGEKSANAAPLMRAIGCASGVIALLSIEMASTGILRTIMFDALPSIFRITKNTTPFGLWVEGARMQSLLGLPNIYATFAAMGFFMMLVPVMAKQPKLKPSAVEVVMLAANGVGLFLSGSRGGVLSFAAACCVLILFAKKGSRRRVALIGGAIVLWCAVTALVLQRWMGAGSFAIWPALGLSIYAAYILIRPLGGLADKLDAINAKRLALLLGAAVLLLAAYLIPALNIRSAFPLYQPDAKLTRAVALRPGTYELTVDMDYWSGGTGAQIVIDSLNPQQAASRTSSALYEGTLLEPVSVIPFTVPQGSIAVHITARPVGAEDGKVSITGLTVEGEGKTAKIPLEYNFIPEALTSRLQGVWADPNVYQRFIYWQDGLRLFTQGPIIGLGGGAFETLSNSVSDYDYYSKHVHNHYIQALVENGILGFLAVLAVFGFAFLALWHNRSKAVVPYLAAALGMMAVHNLTEASMQNLLVNNMFFLLLGIISGVCVRTGQPHGKRALPDAKRNAKIVAVVICVTCVITVGLLGGRLFTQAGLRKAERQGTQQALEFYRWAVVTDPLNAVQYKTACLVRYVADPDSGAEELSRRFVSDMGKNWNTPKDCFAVGRYYLRTGDAANAAKYFERYIELGRMDAVIWNEVLAQYLRFVRNAEPDETGEIDASLARLQQRLGEVNQTALIPVKPDASLAKLFERVPLLTDDSIG